MGDALHLEHRIGARLAVVAGVFAETAFHLAHLGPHDAFKYPLAGRRHHDLGLLALDHFKGLAAQRAGELKFVHVRRRAGAGDDEHRWVVARDHGHRHRLAAALVFHVVLAPVGVLRRAPAQGIAAQRVHAVDAGVQDAGVRIARYRHRKRAGKFATVVLVPDDVADAVQVDVAALYHLLLARRIFNHPPGHHFFRAPDPFGVEVAPLVDPERPQVAPVGAEHVRHQGIVRALDVVKHDRRPAFLQSDPRDSVDLPAGIDLLPDMHHVLVRLQEREKFAHVVPLSFAHVASSSIVHVARASWGRISPRRPASAAGFSGPPCRPWCAAVRRRDRFSRASCSGRGSPCSKRSGLRRSLAHPP